jgi:hypothetical protein
MAIAKELIAPVAATFLGSLSLQENNNTEKSSAKNGMCQFALSVLKYLEPLLIINKAIKINSLNGVTK